VQGTGHSIAEVTGLALGVISLVIADMANPGGSFHVVAAAHAFSRVKFLILKLSSSLSDYLGWSENLAVWEQILAQLRVIAVAIGRKGAEIWAKETNLQPVHG
jgi:hypothetical protein